MIYRSAQILARTLWPLIGRVHVEGLHHIPRKGPFILIANHQSYLDPVIVQAVVPRPIHTMAKSTQFNSATAGAVMKTLKSYPVRRFEIDPQAVRLSLRILSEGHGVGIYIEGERTWDGRLQTLRRGTLRLILKAGAPVVPCGISGAYHIWPRWHHRIKRGNLTLRFGEPMRFPALHTRRERDAALPETQRLITSALTSLSGAEPAPW